MIGTRPLGRTGIALPEAGFGGTAIGNLYAAVSDAEAEAALAAAQAAGMIYLDTAPVYGLGLSELRIGRHLAANPAAPFLLSTKVGRLLRPLAPGEAPRSAFAGAPALAAAFDYSREGVRRSFEASLARLGRDRVDILYLHDIGRHTHGAGHEPLTRQGLEEALPAMAALKAEGRVGAIGLGVNETEVCLRALAEAEIDCILLAGRYTLLEQGALEELLPACAARGVGVVIGGPFNSGLLAGRTAPGTTYNYRLAAGEVRARALTIYEICAAHGVDVGAAALQFVLAHPAVACVIPGGRSAAEVRENAARLGAAIPAGLWRDLKGAGILRVNAPTP